MVTGELRACPIARLDIAQAKARLTGYPSGFAHRSGVGVVLVRLDDLERGFGDTIGEEDWDDMTDAAFAAQGTVGRGVVAEDESVMRLPLDPVEGIAEAPSRGLVYAKTPSPIASMSASTRHDKMLQRWFPVGFGGKVSHPPRARPTLGERGPRRASCG